MANTARGRTGSTLLSIDRLCDEFEINWRAGKEPRIEAVLALVPADAQPVAFRELLEIELELRRERGDGIRKDEYRERFADRTAIVDEVIRTFLHELAETTPIKSSDTAPNSATTCTRYEQMRFFRRGGLGALYRAVDDTLHRETVVKFMNEQCEKDPALVAQFRVEAEVTGRLDHPGIVPVYGIGQDWHGRPFYVMRLINGRELKQAIQEYHDGAGAKRGARLGRQMLFNLLEHLVSACNTVAYAHHVGVVHCDLKPANIMIGKYGETFVLDWGLATNFERSTTFFSPNEPTVRPHSGTGGSSSGQRGGTYGYSSPEQLLTDGPIGPTSDVYSLGATLFEILTGQSPFNGRDTNVRDQIRLGQFPHPRTLQKKICPRLEAICLKAMTLAPHARYPTAKLLADDLTNWMRDEELDAAPDRWIDRVARFGRRHRGITAAFFISLITIIVAAGWIDRTIRIGDYERQKLEQSEALANAKAQTLQFENQGFTIALDAFEDLCRPFANDEVNNLGVLRPVVGKIKNFTSDYLKNLHEAKGMEVHTARVYEMKATIARINENDPQTSLQDLQQAKALYNKVPPTAPEKFDRDMRLAQNDLNQGRLLADLEKWNDALEIFESTAASLEEIRRSHPENNDLLRHLAEAYHWLGDVHMNRPAVGPVREQSLVDSEDKFTESKKIRQHLVSSTSGEDSRNHIRDLARSFGYLGDLYLARGLIPKAIQAFEDSKKYRAELHRTKSGDPEHRFQYARGLGNFGRLDRGYRGELPSAIDNLQKASDIQQELMANFPDFEKFALDFAGTHNTLAEIYLFAALEEPDRASEFHKLSRQSAEKAGQIYGRPDQQGSSRGKSGSAQSLVWLALNSGANAADAQQNAQQAEKLLSTIDAEPRLSGDDLLTLAMARSLQNQTENALRALKMAAERGINEAYRFQQHEKLAFKTIVDDADTAEEFKSLVAMVRDKLTFE